MMQYYDGLLTRRAALLGLAATAATTATIREIRASPVNAATWRTDKGFTSLQRAVNACRAGDELRIQRKWSINAAVKVNKSLTIRCVSGGAVTTTADVHAFNITSSDVALVNLRITGSGGSTAGGQSLIRAVGTAVAPLTGLVVRGCTLAGSRKVGVEMHHATEFSIENNAIRNIAYAAIMISSGIGGRIIRNNIVNVTQPRGFVNSYGIALTRHWGKSMSIAPRTTGIVVSGNTVDGVPKWEAIDTHAGENLTIVSNTVRNALVGIAVLPGRDTSGVYRYGPKGITVRGNTVDSGVRNGTRRAGIRLVGAWDGNRVAEYAEGVIAGNSVTGFGHQSSAGGAAIELYVTRRATIKDNVLRESSTNSIIAIHNNVELIIQGNTMIDTWTNVSAFTACVYVASAHQSVTVRGNKAERGEKNAKKVNDRGTYIGPGAKHPNVTVNASGNNFTACAKPLVYSTRYRK